MTADRAARDGVCWWTGMKDWRQREFGGPASDCKVGLLLWCGGGGWRLEVDEAGGLGVSRGLFVLLH